MVTCSHMHDGHVGNLGGFGDVRLPDLPAYRSLCRDGVLRPTRRIHGGLVEGIGRPEKGRGSGVRRNMPSLDGAPECHTGGASHATDDHTEGGTLVGSVATGFG